MRAVRANPEGEARRPMAVTIVNLWAMCHINLEMYDNHKVTSKPKVHV